MLCSGSNPTAANELNPASAKPSKGPRAFEVKSKTLTGDELENPFRSGRSSRAKRFGMMGVIVTVSSITDLAKRQDNSFLASSSVVEDPSTLAGTHECV